MCAIVFLPFLALYCYHSVFVAWCGSTLSGCSEPTRKGVLVQLACVVVAWRTLQMKRSCVSLAISCRKMCEENIARSVVYITCELRHDSDIAFWPLVASSDTAVMLPLM